MPYAIRTKPCTSCGAEVTKRADPKRPWLCTACAIVRMTDAMTQMYNREGPVWDQWLAGVREADERGAMIAGARKVKPRRADRTAEG